MGSRIFKDLDRKDNRLSFRRECTDPSSDDHFRTPERRRGAPCLVIAELGTSHQGDPGRARALIDAAADAGADCIKFQLVHAEEILHPLSGIVDLPTGKVALYEQFKALERNVDFYAALKAATEARGALFLCSPFGIRSARELRSLGVRALKIASPELNHLPAAGGGGSYGLPLFLSSGVSTLGDIERALQSVGRRNTVLMHCITSYPAPEEQYNVSVLASLRAVSASRSGSRTIRWIPCWSRAGRSARRMRRGKALHPVP